MRLFFSSLTVNFCKILLRDHSKLQVDSTEVSHELHGLRLLHQEILNQLNEMSHKYQETNQSFLQQLDKCNSLSHQHEVLNNQYLELKREREQLYEAFVEMRGEMGTLKTVIME
jgi:uncharacterized coiled-coil DUF342 family protein